MARTAIVTGASRGIGLAIAKALIAEGFRVHCLARSAADLNSAFGSAVGEGQVVTTSLDVTDREAVESFFQRHFSAGENFVDLLFNNAGLNKSFAPVWDSDPDLWWQDVTTNLLGVYLMTRSCLGVMRRSDKGVIVNMDGGRPVVASAYGASKAAVVQFTKTLNEELRRSQSGIAVYAANPGLVSTDMTRAQRDIPVAEAWLSVTSALAQNSRQPEEIASKLVRLLPLMGPERSGLYFSPSTPDGEFDPLP